MQWWVSILGGAVGGLIALVAALIVTSRQSSLEWKQARYSEKRKAYLELIRYVHHSLEDASSALDDPTAPDVPPHAELFASMQAEVALSATEGVTSVLDAWWRCYGSFRSAAGVRRELDGSEATERRAKIARDCAWWYEFMSRMTSVVEQACKSDLGAAPPTRISELLDRARLPLRLWRIRRRTPGMTKAQWSDLRRVFDEDYAAKHPPSGEELPISFKSLDELRPP